MNYYLILAIIYVLFYVAYTQHWGSEKYYLYLGAAAAYFMLSRQHAEEHGSWF